MEDLNEVQDRLNLLIYRLAKNPNAFSMKLGVSGTQIYNIIKGKRNKPSFRLLARICEAYPQINLEWLVLGEGPMFKEEGEETAFRTALQLADSPPKHHEGLIFQLETYKEEINELKKHHWEMFRQLNEMKDRYISLLEKEREREPDECCEK
ncbi:MAG: helix-turn-helix transcriptional regulator [Bacteroidia bacterium]|nr:helix-turn-helix transcriptional regulator [Bacteroidia bacterium]